MKSALRAPLWLILGSLVLVLSLMVGPVAESAGKRRSKREAAPASGWQLVFEDDFNGQTLDERTWTTAFPWGRDRSSVGELQYYAPDAFSLSGSNLRISAKPTPGGSHQYASGLISSHTSFAPEYGRFEIRCKLPYGKGLWPAFWLLPTDTSWPPEIDVFEALGHEPNTVHMTAHWSEGGEHQQKGSEFSGPDFTKDFHTFAVEWSAEKLVWFVDGIERHRVLNKSPHGPMYLLANLAVGGNWPGAPDASTQFPAAFEIDYIRAYGSVPAPTAKEDVSAKDQHKKGKKARKKKGSKRRRPGRIAMKDVADKAA